ncbi:MAG: hypothetical protein OEM52_07555 [bacterium]|nr:hypothetical protein [bacterium]
MRIQVILTLLTLTSICLATPPDALDEALAKIELTRNEFRVDPLFWQHRAGTVGVLPVFNQWFLEPTRIPFWEQFYRNGFYSSDGKLHNLTAIASTIAGIATRRDLIPPTPSDKYFTRASEPNALHRAILQLDATATVPSLEPIPPAIQQAAAAILFAAHDAFAKRELAMRTLSQEQREALYKALSEPLERASDDTVSTPPPRSEAEEWKAFYSQFDALNQVDWNPLSAAADDLTSVIDRVIDSLTVNPSQDKFQFVCNTRYGKIFLNGSGNDTYPRDSYLLIFDGSGDDKYSSGGASSSISAPLGILIDGAGNDEYLAGMNLPAFGVGILGWGFLIDQAGNDSYQSSGFYAQGAGVGGFGILLDRAGDDQYSANGSAQGFGLYGVGVLNDIAGNDQYHSYLNSQGCGLPRGVGVLLDNTGNDSYTANDTDIRFPSPQSNQHNANMSQGAGYGFRRDYVDGRSLGGGVGMLLDGNGNDTYFGGVFVQAVGYWYGIGILDDRSGDDNYRGVWYSQSATAHFGISYLSEGAGNDRYESVMTMGIGAAHDFSASVFYDSTGNDEYNAKANAVGRSLNSSVALFVDGDGDDTHREGCNLGESHNDSKIGVRAFMLSAAVFLDLAGKDNYPEKTLANNSQRIQTTTETLPVLKGIGYDVTNGTILFKPNWKK